MSNLNDLIRRNSSLVDTSGAMHPPQLQILAMEGGVYIDPSAAGSTDNVASILQGRISLGIIGVFILGAVGFYYYTRSIQGGG